MIYLAIIYGIIFFIVGYLIKISLDNKNIRLEEEFYFKFKYFRFLSSNAIYKVKKKPNLFLIQNKSILINPNINAALQEIFDIIILNYINNWYLGFSSNEDFVVEIKYFFHTICTEILMRVSKIDIPELITHKFLPAIINHLDICYTIQHSNNENSTITQTQELNLQKMRSHLHIAMIGRGEELAYLRSVSRYLIPHLTPDYLSQTENKICFHLLQECFAGTVLLPAMDSVASPDLINRCVWLILGTSTTTVPVSISQSPDPVPILHRYQAAWIHKLKMQKGHPKGIESFLRNDKYLYHFLQYIKSINAISPINFFMLMDSITIKLINPSMDEVTKIHLFEDLQRLESLMQAADDYSDLNISLQLHDRVKEVLNDGHENVVQLINCEIWIENYNSICQHTESLYLAQYFESEFYLSTIYGDRQSDIDSSDKQKDFSMTKFGSTLRNALSINSDDSVDSFSGDGDFDSIDHSHNVLSEKHKPMEGLRELPDLSCYRVKIPSISQPNNHFKMKNEFCFSVITYPVDSDNMLFKVHRKYGEFFVLEQKLIEFHGNIGRSLSPRKPWDNKKLDFLDSCKFEFETYLLFLVNRPFLKNSQLLYNFLTDQSEFNVNNIIDINLGRFVKSMPMKLAKEKGQYLDSFLINFHRSCESATKSNSSSDTNSSVKTASYEPPTQTLIDRRMHSRMFWNNAEFINVNSESFVKDVCSFSTHYIFYFFDSLCYFYQIVTSKLNYYHFLMTILYRIRPIFVGLLQTHMDKVIRRGVDKLSQEKVAVELIHNLRATAFLTTDNKSKANYFGTQSSEEKKISEEKLENRDRALKCFYQILPDWLTKSLPTDHRNAIHSNISRIFDCLQQPKLNKQLSYVLFDIILLELFPELADNLAHTNSDAIG